MKKFCRILLLLSPLLLLNPAIAGVDCNGVPHTRLELAICGEPVLRALDSELSAAFTEARERGLMDEQMIAKQRNQMARQCRREAGAAFSACLLHGELKSLELAARRLGQHPPSGLVLDKDWRYESSLASRTASLNRQLAVAENRLRSTGNPELTVLTILSLISVYKEQQSQQISVSGSINTLESKLVSGCNHPHYGGKWRNLLKANNRSCSKVQSPPLYSSADF